MPQQFSWCARFDDAETEHRYQQWRLQRTRARTEVTLIVGTVIFALFGIKDFWLFPAGVMHVSVFLQLGFIAPSLMLLHYLFDRFDARGAQFAIFTAWLVSTVPLIGILIYGQIHDFPIPYEGLIVVTFCVCLLTGVNFLVALLMTLITCSFYIGGMAWADAAAPALALEAFYLTTTSVLGCIGVVLLDASSRAEFQSTRTLEYQALVDPLTNLPNRRAAESSFETMWRLAARNKKSVCVCYVDIDHFKRLNDAAGHIRGDLALRELSAVLANTVQRPLDFVGRLGGEEFVVFGYGMEPEGGLALGEKLRCAVANANITHPDSPIAKHLTISVGVAMTYPTSETTTPDYRLWEAADQALYAAKRAGRNTTRQADQAAITEAKPIGRDSGHAGGATDSDIQGLRPAR